MMAFYGYQGLCSGQTALLINISFPRCVTMQFSTHFFPVECRPTPPTRNRPFFYLADHAASILVLTQ